MIPKERTGEATPRPRFTPSRHQDKRDTHLTRQPSSALIDPKKYRTIILFIFLLSNCLTKLTFLKRTSLNFSG